MSKASHVARDIVLLMVTCMAWLAADAREILAQDAQQPRFADIIDDLSDALGLPTLRAQAPQSETERELRVWIGFGLYQPEEAIRIVQNEQQTLGARTFYWDAPTDSVLEAAADQDPDRYSTGEMRSVLKDEAGCRDFRQVRTYEFCDVPLAPAQSWRELLRGLDSLGIESLPDETSLVPRLPTGIDGTTMVVEVRRGAMYRSYSYWLPRPEATQPEVRRAEAIMELLGSIGER